MKSIKRVETREISLGGLKIGNFHPIRIQTMTKTKTADVSATVNEIHQAENFGADIIRFTVNSKEALEAVPEILSRISIPAIADIHFNWRIAIEVMKTKIAGIRINPGNIGSDSRVIEIIKAAKDYGKVIRIGVNSGSLENKNPKEVDDSLVNIALKYAELFETYDFFNYKISVKSSDVVTSIMAYRKLSSLTKAPLHIGITEAGTKTYGTIKSSIGIGALLLEGIGDTIRVSLTAKPTEEVRVAKFILKSLSLMNEGVEVISCPTCGRTDIDVIALAEEIEEKASNIKKNLKIAVMGCVVNGPGESKDADIGVVGGKKEGVVYLKGKVLKKVKMNEIVNFILNEIEKM